MATPVDRTADSNQSFFKNSSYPTAMQVTLVALSAIHVVTIYLEEGRPDDALKALTHIQHPDPTVKDDLIVKIARIYIATGRPDDAIQAIFYSDSPNKDPLLNRVATMLMEATYYPNAFKAVKQISSLTPKDIYYEKLLVGFFGNDKMLLDLTITIFTDTFSNLTGWGDMEVRRRAAHCARMAYPSISATITNCLYQGKSEGLFQYVKNCATTPATEYARMRRIEAERAQQARANGPSFWEQGAQFFGQQTGATGATSWEVALEKQQIQDALTALDLDCRQQHTWETCRTAAKKKFLAHHPDRHSAALAAKAAKLKEDIEKAASPEEVAKLQKDFDTAKKAEIAKLNAAFQGAKSADDRLEEFFKKTPTPQSTPRFS